MGDIRVCAIGTGRAGMVHARNFRWHVPHAELVAVVDVDAAAAEAAATALELPGRGFSSLAEATAKLDVDAVVVTTPTFTHEHLVTDAAARGIHVLCEKPMALSVESCDAMISACERAGVILQLAFMRRFDPPFVTAKRDLDADLVGAPLIVRSLTRGPGLPPAWANDLKTSNGMLAEVNSHDFDTVRWLGGADIVEVHARAAARKRPDMLAELPHFYDTAIVSATLANGVFGMIDGICPAEYGYDARAEVVAERGVLFAGELRTDGSSRVTREVGEARDHYLSWRDRFRRAYEAEAEHFVRCIRDGSAPSVGGIDGRAAVAAVVAANRSLQEGRSVRVET